MSPHVTACQSGLPHVKPLCWCGVVWVISWCVSWYLVLRLVAQGGAGAGADGVTADGVTRLVPVSRKTRYMT